jgi:hypothetical protein
MQLVPRVEPQAANSPSLSAAQFLRASPLAG